MDRARWRADGLLLLAALIWGSAFVGQVWGMAGLGPLGFTAARFALGALVVAPLAWGEARRLHAAGTPPGRDHLLAAGGFGLLMCVGVVLQQYGLAETSVTHAGFLTALYVPLVPVLGWWLQRRRPHPVVWPAAALCVLGTGLLSAGGGTGATTAGADGAVIGRGDALVLISALPWAVHVLGVGQAANRLRGPYLLACGQFAVCALLAGAASAGLEAPTWSELQRSAGAVLYTGIASVGIGFTLQVVGQRQAPPADAAIVLSTETVFAAVFGAVLLGERLGPVGWAGCGLIGLAVVAVQLLPMRWRPAPHAARRPQPGQPTHPDRRPRKP